MANAVPLALVVKAKRLEAGRRRVCEDDLLLAQVLASLASCELAIPAVQVPQNSKPNAFVRFARIE